MISLIVPTINRVAELGALLTSLARQSHTDFEIIVIDQNPDDRLMSLLLKHQSLTIRHLRCERGVSRARNVGLQAAKGDIIAIPDDDCWYPDQLLAEVNHWFEKHSEYDVLFTGMRNEYNKRMAPKWAPGTCRCTKENIWHCVGSITAFLRARVVRTVGLFNEDIGPGTASKFQSGEDIDYLIRPLEHGFQMWYEPSMTVHHPKLDSVERLRAKTYPYALGVGYVLRTHRYSWWYLGKILMRSLGGAVLNFCKADLPLARIYFFRAVGQLQGYTLGPRDVGRQPKPPVRNMADTL
jgi:glycosyltransferase involved in cell wall biosynthesis